jgi:hypothetical protein
MFFSTCNQLQGELPMSTKGANISAKPARLGWIQIGIIVLTIATAAIHLILAFVAPDPMFTPLFILNAVVYLALLAGLFLPLPFTRENRGLVRWALIGFAALTIVGWLALGDNSWPGGALGYLTKVIELALIALLLVDRRQA